MVENNQSIPHWIERYEHAKQNTNIKLDVDDNDLLEIADTYAFLADQDLGNLPTRGTNTFIVSFGEKFRAEAVTANEHEQDFAKIKIDEEAFERLLKSYLKTLDFPLSYKESRLIIYACKYVVYIYALRYLVAYLETADKMEMNKSVNQFTLLHQLFHREEQLDFIVERYISIQS